MLRRQHLDAVECEQELEVQRLLGPERAVIVEDGDAFGFRDEVRRAFLGHAFDEGDDGLLGLAVVPGRKLVGALRRGEPPAEGRRIGSSATHGVASETVIGFVLFCNKCGRAVRAGQTVAARQFLLLPACCLTGCLRSALSPPRG